MNLPLINFSFDDRGNLVMTPTADGIEAARELVEKQDTSDAAFLSLIEYQLCNGWDLIPPEDIGALTSALIISNDVVWDPDRIKVKRVGKYWSNIDFYQIRSEITDFAKGEAVTWRLFE